jgi:hypothetical protein
VATASLAETHRDEQEALVSLIPAMLREAWPLLDVHDLKGTLPLLVEAVRAILAQFGPASGFAALDYYRRERAAAGVTGPGPSLRIAPPAAADVVDTTVRTATSGLYGTVTPESVQTAQEALDDAVSQLVLTQSRDTIIDAVARDPKARGWVRVTEPGACSFCIMLALRHGQGMVYPAKRAAEFKAHRKRANGAGGECRCHAEPVFTAYEPSHRMRTMQALWETSTKGRSGKDARTAFRQAVEGREVTGTTGPSGGQKKAGLAGMSRERLEHQIALTEGLKDSSWRTSQLARLRGELAKRK